MARAALGGRNRTRSGLRRFSLFVVAAVLAGCLTTHQGRPPPRVEHRAHSVPAGPVVVVVAVDGVRWQDVVDGPHPRRLEGKRAAAAEHTPTLHALLTGSGAFLGAEPGERSLHASGPHFVSLPGYSEMVGGRSPPDCADNTCQAPTRPTLLDQIATEHPGDVAVFTSWPDIGRVVAKNPERLVISTGRREGRHLELLEEHERLRRSLHAGRHARPDPGWGDFRPDRHTADLALGYLELAAPRFLFVSLGETDEHAHHNRYESYLAALRLADSFVGDVLDVLRRYETEGRQTALFVTTDHGRANGFVHHGREHPESSRIWLCATGSLIAARGRLDAGPTHKLASLVPTIQRLLGLPPALPGQLGEPFRALVNGAPS